MQQMRDKHTYNMRTILPNRVFYAVWRHEWVDLITDGVIEQSPIGSQVIDNLYRMDFIFMQQYCTLLQYMSPFFRRDSVLYDD